MKRTLIFGNGFNIQFDKDKRKWKYFTKDVNDNVRKRIDELNISNKISKLYWEAFHIIQREIPKKKINMMNIDEYYSMYEMGNVSEYFMTIMMDKINLLFNDEIDFGEMQIVWMYSVISLFLTTLQSVVIRSVQSILIDKYKLEEIKIPKEITKMISDEYDSFFTTNYDDNFVFEGLIRLHGAFNKKITDDEIFNQLMTPEHQNEVYDTLKINESDITDYRNWYERNAEGNSRIILSGSSLTKKANDEVADNEIVNKFIEPFLEKYKEIEIDRFDFESSYNKLENISGEVDIVGLSPSNDEEIFKILNDNKNITKINTYNTNYEEFWDKYDG